MRAYERLLNYVKIYTTSDEASTTCPSTSRQLDLARVLEQEMKELGLVDVLIDENGYVYGKLPATKGYEDRLEIGFLSHMDTSPDASGENVNPIIHENYQGEDIVLGTSKKVLKKENFPHLETLIGRTLITTDGTTLLGADDKAGIAEIMTACETLIKENIPHGGIQIMFSPDEEIGRGMDKVNLSHFTPKVAYTMDGGPEGEIEYECFNAASMMVTIHGFSVHPGSSKNTMVNAGLVGCEFNSMLPSAETPALTEGYEGFYHLCEIKGDVQEATLEYIIRDHSDELFEAKKKTALHIQKILNEKYGEGTVEVEIKDNYYNMARMVKPHFHLIENAIKATEEAGVTPMVQPIRGGTDGARLSYMGIPCPNLGTGGYGYHGEYEHITVEGMDLAVQIMLNVIELYKEKKAE